MSFVILLVWCRVEKCPFSSCKLYCGCLALLHQKSWSQFSSITFSWIISKPFTHWLPFTLLSPWKQKWCPGHHKSRCMSSLLLDTLFTENSYRTGLTFHPWSPCFLKKKMAISWKPSQEIYHLAEKLQFQNIIIYSLQKQLSLSLNNVTSGLKSMAHSW